MGNKKLNKKLLLWTLGVLLIFAAGIHLLHGWQVQREAGEQFTLARQAEEQGRLEEAATYLSRYLSFAPEDVDALVRRALLVDRMTARTPRGSRRVLAVLEQALARAPARQDIRRRLAARAMDLSLFSKARTHLETLVRSEAGQADLEALLGQCQEAEGDYLLAARSYEQALLHQPAKVEVYVLLADLIRRRLDRDAQADRVMAALVRTNPTSFKAFLARARYRAQYGSPTQAAADLKRAGELAPANAELAVANADMAHLQGQPDEERRWWRQGLKLSPQDQRMYLGLARLEWECGRPREAIACLRQGLRVLPDQPDLLLSLAEILIRQGELAKAAVLTTRLRQAKCPPAYLAFLESCVHIRKQDWARAVRRLEAVTQAPGLADALAGRACQYLGHCYQQLGATDRQLEAYRQAVARSPASVTGRLGLGAALLGLGRCDEAVGVFRRLAQLANAPQAVWTSLARALFQRNLGLSPVQRDWQQVEQALDRADQFPSQAVPATILRAEVLVARERPGAARELLEKARARKPRQVALWAALAELAAQGNRPDQAAAIWPAAYLHIGDRAELRQAQVRFLARHHGKDAAPALAKLEQGLEKFSAEEQICLVHTLAEAYLHLGRAGDVARLCRRISRKQPSDLRSRVLVLEAALHTGNDETIRAVVADLRRLEGEDGTWWRYGEAARLAAGARKGDAKRLEQARQMLAKVERQRPTWSRVPLLQAYLDEQEGNTRKAIAGYLRAIDLGERQPAMVQKVVGLLARAGRFLEADRIIRTLEQHHPLDRAFARVAAEIALRLKNKDRTFELARRAVPPETTDYRDHLWLAGVLAALGRRHETEEVLRTATRLAQRVPDAWTALVAHLARAGQMEEAEATMEDMRAALPADQAPLALAICLEALARTERADKQYQAALSRKPYDFIVLRRAAQFYLRTLQPHKAEPLLGVLLDPTVFVPERDLAWARRQLALVLSTGGDRQKVRHALALLDRNRQAAGDSAEDRRARAFVQTAQPGQRREALRILANFHRSQPLPADEQFRLAQLYEAGDDWPQARELMLGSLALDPHNPAYLAHFIEVLLRRGHKGEARNWVAKLEKLEPGAARTKALRARVGKPAPPKKVKKR
jgi:pentatricopeptide repeat protein